MCTATSTEGGGWGDDGHDAAAWHVDFRRHDLLDNDDVVRVHFDGRESVRRHPDWNYLTLENDFALVLLSPDSVAHLERIRPLALNRDAGEPRAGDDGLEVLGWGLTSGDAHDVARVPHKMRMDYLTNDQCTTPPYLWQEGRIRESMLCAYDETHRRVCNLDGGA